MDIRATLKQALIDDLRLEDVQPQDIVEDAPLFGDGLGLDSLDAIELVVLVERHFGVKMDDVDDARQAFASFNALAEYIETNRKQV